MFKVLLQIYYFILKTFKKNLKAFLNAFPKTFSKEHRTTEDEAKADGLCST